MAEIKKKRKRWSEVTCKEHGTKSADTHWKTPQVKTALPRNKRERMAGCPVCAKELRAT